MNHWQTQTIRMLQKGAPGWLRGLTPDFGSGHDLRVLGLSPASGSLLSGEPASSSLSLCLPHCLLVISVK